MPITWDTASDWDAAASESGVVHESTANTDHNDAGSVKRGYSAASPYLGADLVGYWPFHEDSGTTAYDFSGNSNNGTISGATVGAAGLIDTTAYNFDGVDDAVNFGSLSIADNVSVSVWFKLDALPSTEGNDHYLYSESPASGDFRFALQIDDASDRVRLIYGGSDYSVIDTGSAVTTGTWYHVVGTHNPTDGAALYQDATLMNTGAANTWTSSTGDVMFGIMRSGGGTHFFNGSAIDARSYSSTLSSSDVQYLYDVVNTNGSMRTDARNP